MNYIGSKLSLLDEIRGMLQRQGATSGTFCDLFSGTTVVAQMARGAGFRVIANDMQAYSWVMQKAFLETEGYPDFAAITAAQPAIADMPVDRPRPAFGLGPAPGPQAAPLRRVLAWLEALPPVGGAFYETYCEGGDAGRSYFSQENGRRLEAIRATIEGWRQAGLVDDREFHLLLASLIETMDHLANTASVYGAYLKHVKKTARQPLVMRLPRLFAQPGPHTACQGDANELVERLAAAGPHDVLYLDPPYNQRQYHANYHLLETIARWDLSAFEPRGKTGLRPGSRSRYCSRREVEQAFGELLAAADFKHILVSYNNEGLLSEAALTAMLMAKANGGKTEFRKIPYRRFRADQDHEARRYKGDETHEFLFYVEVKR